MAYSSFKDSNVLFLQGTQVKLNELIANGGAKEGAFYLTHDTHRLYVGRNNGSKTIPVAVNEGVVTVSEVNALPTSGVNAGEFYYATKENILCVFNGSQFIQINKDQNTINTALTNDISATANVATVKTSITDSAGATKDDSFQIKDSSGHTLITVTGKVIDIKADKYTLSSAVNTNVATIALASENTEEDSQVQLVAGDNVTIAADGTNKVKISSSFHNTTIATDGVSLDLTDEGTIALKIIDSDNKEYTASTDAITYKVGNDSTAYVPGETLPVYTKTQVDNLLKNLNGMSYKGTLNSATLPTGVQAGDTYLVSVDGEVSIPAGSSYTGEAINANKGDLLIATLAEGKTEQADGTIATADLRWSYVPAGDDAERDTTYKWNSSAAENKKILREADAADVGSWKLSAGTAMNITSTDTNGDMVTTIAHADVSHTDTTDPEAATGVTSVTAVVGVTVNGQGHVTNVHSKQFDLLDTKYTLSGATSEIIDGGVKVIDTLTASTGGTSTSETAITSQTLTMAAQSAGYSIDIKWGEF